MGRAAGRSSGPLVLRLDSAELSLLREAAAIEGKGKPRGGRTVAAFVRRTALAAALQAMERVRSGERDEQDEAGKPGE